MFVVKILLLSIFSVTFFSTKTTAIPYTRTTITIETTSLVNSTTFIKPISLVKEKVHGK